MQSAYLKSHIALQSLVDIHDQPFTILDSSYRVIAINRAYERAYEITRDRAIGKSCCSLGPSGSCPCPCGGRNEGSPYERVFKGEIIQDLTHRYRDQQGREHLVRILAYPIRTASNEIFVGELIQQDLVQGESHPQTEAEPVAMVGTSPEFQGFLERLRRAAQTQVPILIQGLTGTGKELAAAYIHQHSQRNTGPYQTLDCTTLTIGLFENVVFGQEPGLFTGSSGGIQGLLELADGGTLFIDEIGEMPPPLQTKFLRVMESGEFHRVGGTRTLRVDVRVVCATKRELRETPSFRQDLYYRIAAITFTLPTLTERRKDIPDLVTELLKRIGHSTKRTYSLTPEALAILADYKFPGNVRELRNILWSATSNAKKARIGADQIRAALPPTPEAKEDNVLPIRPDQGSAATDRHDLTQPSPWGAWEAEHLKTVLRLHQGNRRAAAQDLGISDRTLYRKIRLYGLD